MSIRVAKGRGFWGKSGKLGLHMAKPRVLALSTKSKGQQTKAFLRVLKYSTGGVLEPTKLYKLKIFQRWRDLTTLEARVLLHLSGPCATLMIGK
ncbi:hypothetical protein TorRG33x02_149360 [Trema orientale]|uniref:Uncharacterized protein n=1 Tax=Trema orientale TaxID=63057 RepID=A0A2P5EUQ9_TREOI|nr:hypothetical protein TorRG33x02_149360 [Trema orientale]